MDCLKLIEEELEKIKFPKVVRKNVNDKPIESLYLGQMMRPFHGRVETKDTDKYPVLWYLLNDYANTVVKWAFTTVVINKNVVCKFHRDVKNQGSTLIVGVGDYTD